MRSYTTYHKALSILFFACIFASCSDGTDPMVNPPAQTITPTLSVQAAAGIETNTDGKLEFEIKLDRSDFTSAVSFDYSVTGITAEPGVDFMQTSGQSTIDVGTSSIKIAVPILNDDMKEIDETLSLTISNPKNATIQSATAIGNIIDNDESQLSDEDGYNTPTSYYGYSQVWNQDFSEATLDESIYNYEMGDGCPDICGWGNEELQNYTNDEENIKLADGKLSITATQQDVLSFKSARITTKDKVEIQYGRIDVRAKLPKGQGLWPAIWMLGANIDEVGWPACGEIDNMEFLGHEVNKIHGTAHYGEQGAGSTFKTSTYASGDDYTEGYHVFTLIWELNKLTWYVDETKFHSLERKDIGSAQWRFNQPFFFIFNVAVGGRFPGNPDETTVFPQTMDIDYIRVFQPN